MLGMMIPTPSISRKRVRKRIASARLSSTAPPVPTQGPTMIGTPYREVNHGAAGRNLPARHGSASLRDAPLGSPRAAHRAVRDRAPGPPRAPFSAAGGAGPGEAFAGNRAPSPRAR